MRTVLKTTVLMTGLMALSACATAPDPAEVCSAEWVKPRAERALAEIKDEAGGAVKTLRKAGETLAKGDNLGMFQMMAISSSVNKLSKTFENGQGVRDLKTLARTCDDPEFFKTAITDFMRDQGLSEKMIAFLDGFQAYRDLMEGHMKSIRPAGAQSGL